MADEYIKRSDVQDALHSAIIEWNKDCGIARMEYLRIRLNNVPAANVCPVVRGRWIGVSLGDMRCSCCNEVYGVCGGLMGDYNYCPNCGAYMREVDDG